MNSAAKGQAPRRASAPADAGHDDHEAPGGGRDERRAIRGSGAQALATPTTATLGPLFVALAARRGERVRARPFEESELAVSTLFGDRRCTPRPRAQRAVIRSENAKPRPSRSTRDDARAAVEASDGSAAYERAFGAIERAAKPKRLALPIVPAG